MGWGTAFKGYVNRVTPKDVDQQIKECEQGIANLKNELVGMVLMTPIPKPFEDGNVLMPYEYLTNEATERLDELVEVAQRLSLLYQVKEDETAETDL